MKNKTIFFGLVTFYFLSACSAPTAMLGPAYTLSSTGNIYQSGLTFGTNEMITMYTGKTPLENIQDITVKFKKEVWTDAFGSSGTINAIFDLSVELGGSPEHINKDSLNSVKNYLLKPKSNLFVSEKIKQSRMDVLKGGLVIMLFIFLFVFKKSIVSSLNPLSTISELNTK